MATGPRARAAIIAALLATVCGVIYFSAAYPTPWGTDEIVFSWPIAMFMAEASLAGKLKLSLASFMAEDHLSPVFHFYTYLLTLFGGTPHTTINIATRAEYVAILAAGIAAHRALFGAADRTLLFAILLVLNVPLLWTNALFPSFNLSIVLSLGCLALTARHLDTGCPFHLAILGGLSTLTLLSFETGFAFLPLAAGLVSFHFLTLPGLAFRQRVGPILRVGAVLGLSLVPYLLLHAWQYGAPIPHPRTTEMADLGQYVLRAFVVFSEWNFGLFKLAYHVTPYAAVGLGLAYLVAVLAALKARLVSHRAMALAAGLAVQLAAIAYTGRIQSGMWSFAGIVYLMVVADILWALLRRTAPHRMAAVQLALVGALGALFLATRDFTFKDADWYNAKRFQDQTAAYQAAGGDSNDFVLIQLPGARAELNPTAFWYGGKVYNGLNPFKYYPDINTVLYSNMYVQQVSNSQARPFEFFEEAFHPSASRRAVILTRDRNLFTRYFLNLNSDMVLRAAVIPYAAQDAFDINLPAMEKYGQVGRPLQGRLLFATDGGHPPAAVTGIRIDGAPVLARAGGPGEVLFELAAPARRHVLTLDPDAPPLRAIEVRRPLPGPDGVAGRAGFLRVAAGGTPCLFSFRSRRDPDMFSIAGSLEAGTAKALDMLFLRPDIFPLVARHAPFTNDKSDLSVWRSRDWPYEAAVGGPLGICAE